MSNSLRAAGRALSQSADPLWIIVFVSFFAWIFSSALIITLLSRPIAPSTQPAEPGIATTLSVGFASSAIAIVAVVVPAHLLMPAWLQRHGFTPRKILRGLFIGVAWSLVIVPLTMLANSATSWLWEVLKYQHPQAHQLLTILGQQNGAAAQMAIALLATVAAPIAEELLFRGALQPALMRSFAFLPSVSVPISIAITSAVFAFFHGELWMMPPLFVLSLGLGYVAYRSRNLIASITIHAVFNATSIAIFWWLVNHGGLDRYPHL